jgi:hypothetical protein
MEECISFKYCYFLMLMFGMPPSSRNVNNNYVNAISVPSRPKALSCQPNPTAQPFSLSCVIARHSSHCHSSFYGRIPYSQKMWLEILDMDWLYRRTENSRNISQQRLQYLFSVKETVLKEGKHE